jgi:hypothetical protein
VGPWGKTAVVFTVVGLSGEVFLAKGLKEADQVHAEEPIPEDLRLESPLYSDVSTSTGRTIQWFPAQDRTTIQLIKDSRIQTIIVGSVSSVSPPDSRMNF